MRLAGGLIVAVAALTLGPATAGAQPTTGSWWGAGGGALVDFQVKRWRSGPIAASFVAEPKAGCSARQANVVGTGFVKRGRFSIRQRLLGGKVDRRVTGRFTARNRASGTYREIDTTFGRRCDTGTLRWSARPTRRRAIRDGVWNGRDAGLATSFRVQLGGRVMNQIRGQAPSCHGEYPNSYRGPAEMFLIRPDGTFSIPLFALPGSVYAGRFTGSGTAAGTVRAVYTMVDGAVTCESGVHRWSARR